MRLSETHATFSGSSQFVVLMKIYTILPTSTTMKETMTTTTTEIHCTNRKKERRKIRNCENKLRMGNRQWAYSILYVRLLRTGVEHMFTDTRNRISSWIIFRFEWKKAERLTMSAKKVCVWERKRVIERKNMSVVVLKLVLEIANTETNRNLL